MTNSEILKSIGVFSDLDHVLFDLHTSTRKLDKNDYVFKEGNLCKSIYFVLKGSFVQYQTKDTNETIVDLHLQNEWMFNQESLTEQTPSKTTIKAFVDSEILEISLENFHYLCSKSQTFLQFGKIFNQTKFRTLLYDNALNPKEKYRFITDNKPGLTNTFPLKLIASYLKLTPETLSRVRASF